MISKIIGEGEILAQLAEESSELAQAALKLRRVINPVNPTPVSVKEAKENLLEEIADVFVCIDELLCDYDMQEFFEKVTGRMEEKRERWMRRLVGKE